MKLEIRNHGTRTVDPVTRASRWDFPDGSYVLGGTDCGSGGVRLRDASGNIISWGQELERFLGPGHPVYEIARAMTEADAEDRLRGGRRLAEIVAGERKFGGP